jgi:hypothetical protein
VVEELYDVDVRCSNSATLEQVGVRGFFPLQAEATNTRRDLRDPVAAGATKVRVRSSG